MKKLIAIAFGLLIVSGISYAGFSSVWGTIPITSFGGGGGAAKVKGMTKTIKASVVKINDINVGGGGQSLCGAGLYRPSEGEECTESLANYYSPANDDDQYACAGGTPYAPAGSDEESDCSATQYTLQTSTIGGISSDVYVDNTTGLYWATGNQGTSKQYKTSNTSGEPTWNASTGIYTYPSGENKSQYPAFGYCEDLGSGDWRLPTKDELAGILRGAPCGFPPTYSGCTGPAPYTDLPNMVSTIYWSSTEYAGNTSYAWRVNLSNGYVFNSSKTLSGQVVCVHD